MSTTLTDSSAKKVVDYLLSIGRINADEVQEILMGDPPDDLKVVTDLFHTYFCTLKHAGGECSYYEELPLDVCWQKKAHKEWIDRTLSLMRFFHISSVSVFAQGVKKVINIWEGIEASPHSSFLFYLIRLLLTQREMREPQPLPDEGGVETSVGSE